MAGMEFNGLPLHPLVVHAAVVLAPVGALVALAYVVRPAWRQRLRWWMPGLAIAAVGALAVAYLSGSSFLHSRPDLATLESVQTHRTRAHQLVWVTVGFFVTAAAATRWGDRSDRVGLLSRALLAVFAVGLLVVVFLTGDAGARAVWG